MDSLWVEGISPGGDGEGDKVMDMFTWLVTGGLCWRWKYPSALLDPLSPISGV